MKPNQKNRYSVKYTNRSAARLQLIYRNTSLESTGPAGKLHGTALQLSEKYQAAAKDALIQNDAVLAETYLQYADHYVRLQNQAIANEQAFKRPVQNVTNETMSESVTGEVEEDSLPDFSVPTQDDTEEKSAEETVEDEGVAEAALQMDLSVPVMAIQQNNSEEKKKRRFPRKKKTEES